MRRNIVLVLLFFVVFVAMFVFETLGATRHVKQVHQPSASMAKVAGCCRLSIVMQPHTVLVDSDKLDIEMRDM
jgi:hypothetical protein